MNIEREDRRTLKTRTLVKICVSFCGRIRDGKIKEDSASDGFRAPLVALHIGGQDHAHDAVALLPRVFLGAGPPGLPAASASRFLALVPVRAGAVFLRSQPSNGLMRFFLVSEAVGVSLCSGPSRLDRERSDRIVAPGDGGVATVDCGGGVTGRCCISTSTVGFSSSSTSS